MLHQRTASWMSNPVLDFNSMRTMASCPAFAAHMRAVMPSCVGQIVVTNQPDRLYSHTPQDIEAILFRHVLMLRTCIAADLGSRDGAGSGVTNSCMCFRFVFCRLVILWVCFSNFKIGCVEPFQTAVAYSSALHVTIFSAGAVGLLDVCYAHASFD